MRAGAGIVFKENAHIDTGPTYIDPLVSEKNYKKCSRNDYDKLYGGKSEFHSR